MFDHSIFCMQNVTALSVADNFIMISCKLGLTNLVSMVMFCGVHMHAEFQGMISSLRIVGVYYAVVSDIFSNKKMSAHSIFHCYCSLTSRFPHNHTS